MFTQIDNHDGTVSGIYTGYSVFVDPASLEPRADAFAAGLNTEHTWPQSKGAGSVPARADLHHLFPSEIDANNARASFPFAEIPDPDTDTWYRLLEATPTPNPLWLPEYSELDRQNPNPLYEGRWEPREGRKGDVARAMFYFYTVYRAEVDAADPGYFGAQMDDLRAWHVSDPVDDQEYQRTCAIAPYQADKVNPFVIDPTLVDRAYFAAVPVQLLFLRAEPAADGVHLLWETSHEADHAGFHVIRSREGVDERLNPVLLTGGPSYMFLDRWGRPGTTYAYSLEAVGRDGSRECFGPRVVEFPGVAIRVTARPNPARSGQVIRFDVTGAVPESVDLFDLHGRMIRSWGGEEIAEGWDGRSSSGEIAPSGVYFVRVTAGNEVGTFRFVRIR
jgi:hypothetical protein